VTLSESGAGAGRNVAVEERTVGRTRFQKLDLDAATIATQPELEKAIAARADPNLVLEVRLTGIRPDELDVNTSELEDRLKPSFLRLRVRDVSMPALSHGALPSADTILGAFIRDVEGRIAELEADPGDSATTEAAELRDVLRLGRLLLSGHEVTL
jgi:hypothetical protein